MDLQHAIEKHTEWKNKLATAITSMATLDADAISKDHNCELGKWLYGEGKAKHGSLASYVDCVTKHAAFHREAGKIASAVNAKDYAKAKSMMGNGTPFVTASNAVAVAILRLKKEAGL